MSWFRNKSAGRILLLILCVAYSAVCAGRGGDFDVFLDAGQKLFLGQNIYQPPFFKNLQYYYSPAFALLLLPFSFLPFYVTEFIWLLLNLFWLYRICELSIGYFPIDSFRQKEIRLWIIISLFFVLRFVLYNFSMIQMTIFMLWSILESLHFFSKKKRLLGGLLLASAINFKLLPLPLLPYLLWRGEHKGFFSTMVFFAFLLLLPAFFFGFEHNLFLHKEWWAIINPGQGQHLTDDGTHSLVSVITVFLMDTPTEPGFKRNFLSLDNGTVVWIINLARMTLTLATLMFLRSKPFVQNHSRLKDYWEISYIALVTPLIMPHQQKYSFVLILPAVIYLTYYFLQIVKYRIRYWPLYVGLILIFSIPFTPFIGSDILGRKLYNILDYFRVLSLSTLGLGAILLICSPMRLSEYRMVPQPLATR